MNLDPAVEAPLLLPDSEVCYQKVQSYIEQYPEADYQHASPAAREAFRDFKYGIRIHWGLYSIWELGPESWPLLHLSNERKQAYQELYRSFNPVGFNAEAWMGWFNRVGLRCFAFTTKHHEGFSMYDTRTRVRQRTNWMAPGGPRIESCDGAYSIMETPFQRDIVKELCLAARSYDMKIDLYYSHPDWYDADFRPYVYHPLQVPASPQLMVEYAAELAHRNQPFVMTPDLTPAETARMLARHRAQLVELLTQYGNIDMICLDMWLGPAVWPHLRETVKLLRRLQPDVMLRARGIGNYGDYYTPEGFVPGEKEPTAMPWMVIYPLADWFSYDPEASHYKGSGWIVRNLVDAVAKGGNFMVGIGPDGNGHWHPAAVAQLNEAGEWLKVNGEAIYGTRERPGDGWHEGDDIRFTRTKDGRIEYAHLLNWPGASLSLRTVHPAPGSQVFLLGHPNPLRWQSSADGTVTVALPEATLGRHAYVIKFEVQP